MYSNVVLIRNEVFCCNLHKPLIITTWITKQIGDEVEYDMHQQLEITVNKSISTILQILSVTDTYTTDS